MSLSNKVFDFLGGISAYDLTGYRTITYTNKWTPIFKNWAKLEEVTNTNPVSKKCVNIWQGLADYYDLKVKVNVSSNQESNERAEAEIQKVVDKHFRPLIKKAIQILAEKGNCYLMVNSDGELIVQHPDFFNLYWDQNNQKPYFYKYIIDGVEQPQELQHGQEIFHLRNPFNKAQVLSSAPIESGMKEIEAYTALFAYTIDEYQNGLSGNVLATVKKRYLDESVQIEDEVPKWAKWSKTISDLFNKTARKQSQGSKIIPVNFAENFFKFGGNLKDMEALAILEKQVEFIASCYSLTAQDLGFGKTTYRNTEEFGEQQEEKIGKPLKVELEEALNGWVLPKLFKIDTFLSTGVIVKAGFEVPNNEDTIALRKQTVDLLKTPNLPLTDTEKRQILIDNYGLSIVADDYEPPELPAQQGQTLDAENVEKEEGKTTFSFKKENKKKEIIEYIAKNRIQDKAFDSFYYSRTERNGDGKLIKKGFLSHLENAFEKQIKRTAENMKKNDSLDLSKNFVKLETVLPFNVLNSDLQNFADFSKTETEKEIKRFLETKEVKRKIGFDLSEPVKKYFEVRTKLLLQGYGSLTDEEKEVIQASWQDQSYKGLDEKTQKEVQSVINKNLDKPTEDIIELILKVSKDIGDQRAVMIAETEVVNAVERVRFETYKENDFKVKRHLMVRDDRVVEISKEAAAKGVVPIDYVYRHQIGDGLASPLHFRERGSEVYGFTKEDLAF